MHYRIIIIIIFFFFLLPVTARVIYTSQDSILVENLLIQSYGLSGNDKVLFFAESFLENPYKAATLDVGQEENLIINLREFDCTTFVETVLALYIASESEKKDFNTFREALRTLRYREGILNGYISRLHYFSEWISDNEKKGIVKDITTSFPYQSGQLSINYMSANPEDYPQLKNDLSAQKQIRSIEERMNEIEFTFIPKGNLHQLHAYKDLQAGQIIVITTDIAGLDVTHTGFATRKNNKIHLLHASSRYKKIILDPLPLDEYVKGGKRNTGIKVLTLSPDLINVVR